MDINNFVSSNVDNYNDVRDCTITSNKISFRIVFMFLSKTSVDYATKMEWLNNISDENKFREPINSSQLSYAEKNEI